MHAKKPHLADPLLSVLSFKGNGIDRFFRDPEPRNREEIIGHITVYCRGKGMHTAWWLTAQAQGGRSVWNPRSSTLASCVT